jgi:nucleotide-binding universal stress UspA family protein
MAPPLLTWALSHIAISEEERERLELANHRSFFDKRTLRILLPTAGGPNAAVAIRIAAPLVTSADAAITALFVHNDEAAFPTQGFFSRLWRQPSLEASTPLQPLLQLGQEYGIHIDTKIVNAEGKPAGDIILQEVKRGYDLLALGASGYRHPLGGAYIDEVLAAAPTHVAIIKARDEKPKYEHLLVPTYGEGDSQLAIEFAAMYADTLVWQLRPRRTKPELQLTAKVVEEKRPETALLREIQSGGYDLLILSASLRGARPPHVLDPTVEHIVNEAPCTVIVIIPKHTHVGFPH